MKITALLVYLLLSLLAGAAAFASDSDDGMMALLQGEFALQQGDTASAALAYTEAAEVKSDPVLAERAVQVALAADSLDVAARAIARWKTLAPEASGLGPAHARLALKREDQPAAVAAVRALLVPGQEWRGAIQALAAGNSPIALPVLKQLVEEGALPSELDAWLAFGGLAQRLGAEEVSATLAEKAAVRFPDLPRAWLWKAEAAQRSKNPAAAREAIAKAVSLGPLDAPTRLAVAAQLDALGDPQAAAAALAVGAQDDTTLAGRAAYLARADDEDALAQLYELAAAEAGEASEARLYLLGQLAELQEKSELALSWYERVPRGVQREQAQLRIAVLLDKLDRTDDALVRLRELQASDSDYGEILRDAYLLEAELLIRRERGDEALDAYARGLQIFEDDPELIYARALTHERLDRVGDAEADLRRLIDMDPENADALNALGYTLADRTDRYQEALVLIERALKLKPDTPAIIDSLGWVLYRLGRTADALPHLRRAFELQRDAEVAAHLGEVLWVSGEQDEARSIWRLGREIDPDNRALKQVLERFGQ